MICKNCGKTIPNGAVRCAYCHQPVEFESDKSAEAAKKQGLSNKTKTIVIAVVAFVVVAVLVVIGVLFGTGSASTDPGAKEGSILPGDVFSIAVNDYDEALVALDGWGFYYGYDDAEDVYVSAEKVQETGLFTVYYFNQMYEDIPVAGHNAKVIVNEEDGSLLNVVANYTEIPQTETEPTVDEEAAVEAANAAKGNYTSTLCIYVSEELEEPVLAWNIVCGKNSTYVDANTGKVIETFDLLNEFDAGNGLEETLYLTGQDKDAGEKPVDVLYDETEKQYYMCDGERNYNVYSLKEVDLNKYGETEEEEIVSFKKENKANKAAVDAAYNINQVYDFYSEVLNHNSVDGNGEAELFITVNTKNYTNADSKKSEKLSNSVGGALSSVEDEMGIIMFSTLEEQGYTPSYYYDVVAHEYAHLVNNFIIGSDGLYSADGATIAEAYADIMAAISSAYYSDDGQIDWNIEGWGEGRNIAEPGDWYVLQYSDYNQEKTDAHYSSTILSNVAYTMNSGDIAKKSKITDYELLAQLWYNALYLMTPDAELADCRAAVERTAEIMLAEDVLTKKQYEGVKESFGQSGIPEVSDVYVVTDDTEVNVYTADMNNGGAEVEYQNYSYEVSVYDEEKGQLVVENTGEKGSDVLTVEDLRGDDITGNKLYVKLKDSVTNESCRFVMVVWDDDEKDEGYEETGMLNDEIPVIEILTQFGSSTYISGTVVDEEGNPVENVSVSLQENGDNWGQKASVKTNENGEYQLFLYYENQGFTLKFKKNGCETVKDEYKQPSNKQLEEAKENGGAYNLKQQVIKRYSTTLKGTVYDESGNPLEGVKVSAKCKNGKTVKKTTDKKGKYSLKNVFADEEYTIKYSKTGYATVKEKLQFTEKQIDKAKEGKKIKLSDVVLSQGEEETGGNILISSTSRFDNIVFAELKIGKADISTIIFEDTLKDVSEGAKDVSEAQNGSVMAWVEDNGKGGHMLYIAGEGGVEASGDSSYMFENYTGVTEIDFNNCFDTSNVTDMSYMFSGCYSLKKLDLGSFDTSNVTNHSEMFAGCSEEIQKLESELFG